MASILKNLNELHLNNNNITDLSVFENNIFNQLQKLVLNHNNIKDLTPLKNSHLFQLQELFMGISKPTMGTDQKDDSCRYAGSMGERCLCQLLKL